MAFLESLASTGIFNEAWSDWKHVIENRLKQNLWLFGSSNSSTELENGIETENGIPLDISELDKTLFDRITNVLLFNFSSYPPYTIQRLAELILRPKLHYKSLSKYLRAVEKTVMVTSTTEDFKVFDTNSCDQKINDNDPNIPNLTPVSWIYSDENESS